MHWLQFEDIKRHLTQFVQFCWQAQKPVTIATLSFYAHKIREQLLQKETKDSVHFELKNFSASKNWVLVFNRLPALRSHSPHGKAGSASAASVAKEITEDRAIFSEYPLDHVYNKDETVLFLKLLPRHTYVMNFEGRCLVRGIKAMKGKVKITASICNNADGWKKTGFGIIGKVQNPICFRIGQRHVTNFIQ